MICTCGASGGIDGHSRHCMLRQGNRVLVGVPERLNSAREALRDCEKLIESLRVLYRQRSLLKDSVVLDQIGELLGEKK